MERGRAWRRDQEARVFKNRHVLTRRVYGGTWSWRRWTRAGEAWFTYSRRNSQTETVEVEVHTSEQLEYYLDLMTKKLMNNPVNCGCSMCKRGRTSGYGNSQQVLTRHEGSALNAGVAEIMLAIEDVQPRNFTWRSRKWRSHG